MPPPEGTPQFFAELMTRCWNEDPDKRPNIKHIVHWLKSALKNSAPEKFVVSQIFAAEERYIANMQKILVSKHVAYYLLVCYP